MNPTFLTQFLGCRTNQKEIEEITQQLLAVGFIPFEEKKHHQPNLIIFNSCVVTQKAESETRNMINRFQRKYPSALLVVIGCGAEGRKKKLISLPAADLFLGMTGRERVLDFIKEKIPFSPSRPLFSINQLSQYLQSGRALIKIQEGCNHFCSYCIVPLVRGLSKSIPEEKILEEVKNLPPIIKEIILVGTAISQWGKDLKPKKTFLDLLNSLLRNTAIPQITLSSLDPEILDDKFAKFWAINPRFSSFLHLSLQSGSPRVLKDMRRNLQINKLIKAIELIKSLNPKFCLRADIIVGFPTETKRDFQKTLQLIRGLEISFTHVFPFSPRPGTLAFEKIKKGEWQDLPPEIKKERVKIVQKEAEKIREKVAKNLKGKILRCLILTKTNSFYQGIAENSFPVKIRKRGLKQGDLIKAKISGYKNNFLEGKTIGNF